jgi:lactoylglutathione lyase
VTHDLDNDWERALAAGAALLVAPKPKPWGQTVGYLRDLNGVVVELCTPSPRESADP